MSGGFFVRRIIPRFFSCISGKRAGILAGADGNVMVPVLSETGSFMACLLYPYSTGILQELYCSRPFPGHSQAIARPFAGHTQALRLHCVSYQVHEMQKQHHLVEQHRRLAGGPSNPILTLCFLTLMRLFANARSSTGFSYSFTKRAI